MVHPLVLQMPVLPPQTARVPLEKVRGFRGPFLLHNQEQRAMLRAAGFAWDSTITATWAPGSFQPDGQHTTWPWTLDWGVPLVGHWPSGLCQPAAAVGGQRTAISTACTASAQLRPLSSCLVPQPRAVLTALPQNCETGTGNCSTSERQPGLWEFPIWDIQVRGACSGPDLLSWAACGGCILIAPNGSGLPPPHLQPQCGPTCCHDTE